MFGLALVFGGLLYIAQITLAVEKGSRVEKVLAVLPGANCGACGFAGCTGLLIIIASTRVYASVAIISVLLTAASLAIRELVFEHKPGRVLLGALRVGILFCTAVALLVDDAPCWVVLVILPFGLWAAIRPLRRGITICLLGIGVFLARRFSRRGVERVRRASVATLRAALPLRYLIVRNMQRAGVYRRGLEQDYWDRAGDQMGMLMHILRAGYPDSGVRKQFHFDGSERYLQHAYTAGHGILLLSPHLCGYPVFPRVLADHVPCSIYLRHSPDPTKHTLNMLMGKAGGGHLVCPQANTSPTERLNVAMRVLRQKRALYVTPDLPRKASEGVPVTLWGRVVYFPIGVMIMAIRTGAAVIVSTWYYNDGLYHVHFTEPYVLERHGDRQSQAREGMLTFARIMDQHLHAYPEMWWNWLDKRWTRILRSHTNADTARDQTSTASSR